MTGSDKAGLCGGLAILSVAVATGEAGPAWVAAVFFGALATVSAVAAAVGAGGK